MADDDTPPAITRDPTPVIKRDPTPVIKRDQPTDQPSAGSAVLAGIGHGLTDLFYGGAQLGARMGPDEGGAAFADPADLEARKQTVDKTVAAREQAYQAEPAVKAHPHWAYAGDITGQVAATAPLFAAPGALPTLPARMLGAGITGGLVSTAEPVTSPGDKPGEYKAPDDYGAQKTGQVAAGTVSAAIGQPIGEGVSKVLRWGVGKVGQLFQSEEQAAARKAAEEAGETAAQKEKATTTVEKKLAEAQKSGRLKAGDIIQEMTDARAAGQPITLLDVDPAGGPVRRLGGTIYRGPGDAGGLMHDWQEARTYGIDEASQRTAQGVRLERGIREQLASGDATQAAEELANRRSANARPLWDAAMEGGSTAPLEHQFTQEFTRATEAEAAAMQQLKEAQTRLVAARAKQQTSAVAQREAATTPAQLRAKEVGALGKQAVTGASLPEAAPSGFNEAERAASNDVAAAEQTLAQTRAMKEGIRTRLRQAQEDGTANAKGAVWSPDLQILLDNPRVKAGINKGYVIERDKANAAFRPINTREYAIVGMDENGDPIVGKVPNMKLIQMAKEGLDGLLEDEKYRDKYTRRLTKEGQGIDDLRRSLLAEGDRLNPDWKAAREQWAGDTAELEALADGRAAMGRDWSIRDFRSRWAEMAPGQRENFKLGVADKMIQDLDFARLSGDESRAMINSTANREKLRTMFGQGADGTREFNQFIKFIERERTMWETGNDIMRGTQTAERRATDEQSNQSAAQAGLHAAHGAGHLKVGNILGAARSFLSAAVHLGWGQQDPSVNLQVAKLLTDPNIELRQSGDRLLIGPAAPRPPATWRDWRGGAAQGLGGDIGTIISTGPESMFYSAPDSFSPP